MLSFDMGMSAHLTPLLFIGTATGAALCLGWIRSGASWMLGVGLVLLLDVPVYLLWLMLLRHVQFDLDKLYAWFASNPIRKAVIRILALLMLLVCPVISAAWWALREDHSMAWFWALFSLTSFLWLYLDIRRGFSNWLVGHEYGGLYVILAIPAYFFILGLVQVIVGVRYCYSTSVWSGCLVLCALSSLFGFIIGIWYY
jgi:hypothetical protein